MADLFLGAWPFKSHSQAGFWVLCAGQMMPERGCLGKGPGLGQKEPLCALLSPQAACGIEEDLRVHRVPGHVAVAITPAREGNDDPVSQNRQGISHQLLLELVSGRQVPEQP